MRLFAFLAASQAAAEIIVPDIIRGKRPYFDGLENHPCSDALAKSDCASNTLEKCAMRVKQDMEAAITYENWNCIVAAENAGQYSSLKVKETGKMKAENFLFPRTMDLATTMLANGFMLR